MSENHLVTKPAAVFSFYTIISRIFGLVRDMLAAAIFGASALWDAFVVAFTIPNLFRRILGEGALGASFVPVFSEYRHKYGEEKGWQIANVIVTLLVIISVFLTVSVILLLGLLKQFVPFTERVLLVITLCQYMFPYMIFVCMVGLFMGILSAFHRLAIPAFAPAMFNLILIIVMLVLMHYAQLGGEIKVKILAVSVVAGGFCSWLIHLPVLRAVGMRYKFIALWRDPAVKRIFSLMGPMIIGFGVIQINVIVDRLLALWLGPGAASKLYFGNRLMQLPLGVFGAALAVAVLSLMSKQIARNDMESFRNTLSYGLRLVFFVGLPAGVGLMILGMPLVKILFQHRAFTVEATVGTARVLCFYSLGLFAYMGVKIVTQGFYALQDSRTPVKIAGCMVGLNLILNLILMIPLREAGLALATAICAFINMLLLMRIIIKRLSWDWFPALGYSILRSFLVTIVMGTVCFLLAHYFGFLVNKGVLAGILYLLGNIVVSVSVYITVLKLIDSQELHEIMAAFLRKR